MVEILPESSEACVVVRLEGMITGDEYRVFLDAVTSRLEGNKTIDVVADLSEIKFYGDFEAFREDLHFGTHEFRKVRRAAFVGDQKWIDVLLKLMSHFYRAEDRHFPKGQLEEAVAWASSR